MTKIKTSILLLFHSQPILCLAFCCLIFYLIQNYSFKDPLKVKDRPSPSNFYIEFAKAEEFPVLYAIGSSQELERVVPSSVYTKIKPGDKIIIHDNGTTSLSRISGKKRLALGIPIGLNSASIDDLTALPGVGIKLAERIVEYKKLNGSFKSVDELDNVKGFVKKKIEAIKPSINLD